MTFRSKMPKGDSNVKNSPVQTSALPETGYLRLRQILGDKKVTPPIPALIPVGKSTWWAGVKTGHFPKPVKLGVRTSAWRVGDIRGLIERLDLVHQNAQERKNITMGKK